MELAFNDDAEPGRLDHRPAHRELLAGLHAAGTLVMAGPFPDDKGAQLLFEVADLDELNRVLDADPYYGHPAVRIVRRQEWHPVIR